MYDLRYIFHEYEMWGSLEALGWIAEIDLSKLPLTMPIPPFSFLFFVPLLYKVNCSCAKPDFLVGR